MRVRVLKDHSSPLGPKRSKHKGDEFTVSAADAQAHIDAGLVKEVSAPKADKAK
jgi:hypothetical protein